MSTKIHHDEHCNNLDDDQVEEEEEGEGNEASDNAVGDADVQHRVLHLLPHLRLLNQNTAICPLKDNTQLSDNLGGFDLLTQFLEMTKVVFRFTWHGRTSANLGIL